MVEFSEYVLLYVVTQVIDHEFPFMEVQVMGQVIHFLDTHHGVSQGLQTRMFGETLGNKRAEGVLDLQVAQLFLQYL